MNNHDNSPQKLRVAIFFDQDRALHNFLEHGVFENIRSRFDLKLIAPPPNKRMRVSAAESYPEYNWHYLGDNPIRSNAWSRLALLDQMTWRPGSHWRKVRRMRRLALKNREKLLLSLAALPIFNTLERWRLHRRLMTSSYDELDRFLDDYQPDIVLHPSALNGIYVNDLIKSCRERRIPCMIIMNSWDNPSTKNTVLEHPDKLLVWGPQTRDHAMKYMGLASDRIHIIGAAQLERYYRKFDERDVKEALARSGLDTTRTRLFYAASSIVGADFVRLKLIDDWASRHPLRPQVLYRPYPIQRRDDEREQILRFNWQNVIVQKSNSEMGQSSFDSKVDALLSCHAVISPLSTILLEALMLNKPIMCIYPTNQTRAEFSPANAPLVHFDEILRHEMTVVSVDDTHLDADLDRLMRNLAFPDLPDDLRDLINHIVSPFSEPYGSRLAAFVERATQPAANRAISGY